MRSCLPPWPPGSCAAATPEEETLSTPKGCEDTPASFWTPVENPGTRPPRSRVFDITSTLLAAPASFGSFPSPRRRLARSPVALSLVVAVMTGRARAVASLERTVPGRAGDQLLHRRGHA